MVAFSSILSALRIPAVVDAGYQLLPMSTPKTPTFPVTDQEKDEVNVQHHEKGRQDGYQNLHADPESEVSIMAQ